MHVHQMIGYIYPQTRIKIKSIPHSSLTSDPNATTIAVGHVIWRLEKIGKKLCDVKCLAEWGAGESQ